MAVEYTDVFAAIGAAHFAATVDFYRKLFNREPDERIGDIYVAFRLPGLHLGIFEPSAQNRQEFENHVDLHSGLNLVLQVPTAEKARAELQALHGLHESGEIRETKHGREFCAYDPEGNRLIVVERNSTK